MRRDGFKHEIGVCVGGCLTENCRFYPKAFKCIIFKSTKLPHHTYLPGTLIGPRTMADSPVALGMGV